MSLLFRDFFAALMQKGTAKCVAVGTAQEHCALVVRSDTMDIMVSNISIEPRDIACFRHDRGVNDPPTDVWKVQRSG